MKKIATSLLAAMMFLGLAAKENTLSSPDGRLNARFRAGEQVSIEISKTGQEMFTVKNICLKTADAVIPAAGARITSFRTSSTDRIINPVIRERNAEIEDRFNEAVCTFSDRTKIVLRLFNNGAAYRIITDRDGELTIFDEPTEFIFDTTSTFTYQKTTYNTAEQPYVEESIGSMKKDAMAGVASLVKLPSGDKVVIMESDKQDYPVLWVKKGDNNLRTHFWKYPRSYRNNNNYYNQLYITEYEEYIARTSGRREFPWRVFAIAENDGELLSNELVYQLAPECRIEDTSWIKPGWVTFDWWSKNGIYGVDFKAGINNPTAEYMIDFASRYGMRYFLFDDGWTKNNDLTQPIDALDIKHITEYAAGKGVDIMLWVPYSLLTKQMDRIFDKFSEWGIKGIKVDFMDRDDQEIVNFYWDAAKKAAEHHMVVDFHGAFCPDGLRRAYPNVLTREGLIEFEFNGMGSQDSPRHHCTLPFIRCVAGPADYIPGTMNNATKWSFRTNGNTPMGQGTRAHAMAMALVVESPMVMISDPQTDYIRENECSEFLLSIPVEWDKTVPLDCKLGEYVSVARKNGTSWYVAAITNWDKRNMKINLGFLDKGKRYRMELFRDGINADIRATDYKHEFIVVNSDTCIDASLVSGGGWIAKITEL